MSIFNFTLPNGQTFELKAPEGVTYDQAQAIFKQQVDTGGLVGFKVGDTVSVVTQAVGGLASAQASALQSINSALGKLTSGTDLKTITDSIGVSGVAAVKQAQSALLGANAALSSVVTNLNTAVNGTVGGLRSLSTAVGGINTTLGQNLGALSSALTGSAAQVGSVANDALKTIQRGISETPLNGITISDFIKQGPSLGPIGNLSQENVTATLAQASKLVGQSVDQISNSIGLGKFGLDGSQLEASGFLKPGTISSYYETAKTNLSSLLNSPLPWTGKDGVKSVTDLLGNEAMQNKIQQGLMTTGLNSLGQLGIPVKSLSPEALSGLSTAASKSISDTFNALKTGDLGAAIGTLGDGVQSIGQGITSGLGIDKIPPIGSVTDLASVATTLGSIFSNSSFSSSFVAEKVEPPVKQQEIPPAATDTVDEATLNAAAHRIIGNDKVPDISNNTADSDAGLSVETFSSFVNTTLTDAQAVGDNLAVLEQSGTITQQGWSEVNQEFINVKNTFNAKISELQASAADALKAVAATDIASVTAEFQQSQQFVTGSLIPLLAQLKMRIDALSNKIIV